MGLVGDLTRSLRHILSRMTLGFSLSLSLSLSFYVLLRGRGRYD